MPPAYWSTIKYQLLCYYQLPIKSNPLIESIDFILYTSYIKQKRWDCRLWNYQCQEAAKYLKSKEKQIDVLYA